MINKLGSLLSQKYADLKENKKGGFTLIELVVVIAIMAILALIMVPNLTAYIGKADEAKIMTNMKNLHNSAEMVQQTEGFSINTPADNDDFIEAVVKYSNIKDVQLVGEPEGAELARLVSEDRNGFISEVYTLSRNENTGNITVRYLDKKEAEFIFNGHTFIKDGEIVDEDKGGADVETPESDPADLYEYDGGTITGFNWFYVNEELDGIQPKDIVLPGVSPDGVKVTAIGGEAFHYNQLTSVVIPDSVTSIGERAFEQNNITNLEVGNNVKLIGDRAFLRNEITSVVIPNGVTYIGNKAFEENQLTSVVIPEGVTYIGNEAFTWNRITGRLAIPDSVVTIGDSAFMGNQLTSVVIPDSVTSVGRAAFNNNNITSIKIGGGLEVIEENTFGINQISSLVIPKNIKVINEYAFNENTLSDVKFEDGLKTIEDNAFAGNENIISLVIPGSVTSIGEWAFAGRFPAEEPVGGWVGTWDSISTGPWSSNEWVKQ